MSKPSVQPSVTTFGISAQRGDLRPPQGNLRPPPSAAPFSYRRGMRLLLVMSLLRLAMTSSGTSGDQFSFESDSEGEDANACDMFAGLDGADDDDLSYNNRSSHGRPAGSSRGAPDRYSRSLRTDAAVGSPHATTLPAAHQIRTDGRGKYSRSDGKGAHLSWPARCAAHVRMYEEGRWLQAGVCTESCPHQGQCLAAISKLDVRDCCLHIFGHGSGSVRWDRLRNKAAQQALPHCCAVECGRLRGPFRALTVGSCRSSDVRRWYLTPELGLHTPN